MSRNQKIFIGLLVSSHIAGLVIGMLYRFVDGDEGGTLVVTREVINGRVPIIDINAHNQPLLYYLYGLWMKLFGFDVITARSLSILAIFGTGIILIWWTYRFSKNYIVAVIVYFLFITNLTFFKTNIPVKPFALSNFFIFAAFALITAGYISKKSIGYASVSCAGFLLGLSLGVRFIYMLPVVFVLWLAFVMFKERERIGTIALKITVFSSALAVPLLPSAVIFAQEPFRAYTLWGGAYAQIYLGKGNNPDFAVDVHGPEKLHLMANGLMDALRVPDTLFLVLLLAISVVVFFFAWRRRITREKLYVYSFIWLVFAGIILVYAGLYQNYIGYVNQIVVFAILLTLPLFESVAGYLTLKRITIVAGVFLLVFASLFYVHFQKKLKTSIFYIFDPGSDIIITPRFVDNVSENVVKRLTKKDDRVLDVWGVFVFASGRRPVKGFEYPTDMPIFWRYMKKEENAAKYLFISRSELFGMIERQDIPLVILSDPKEFHRLVNKEDVPDPLYSLKDKVEQSYVLYKKYFVKPTNAWLLIYRPAKILSKTIL